MSHAVSPWAKIADHALRGARGELRSCHKSIPQQAQTPPASHSYGPKPDATITTNRPATTVPSKPNVQSTRVSLPAAPAQKDAQVASQPSAQVSEPTSEIGTRILSPRQARTTVMPPTSRTARPGVP